jgi:YadA-like membrane anchor domain
MKSVLKAIALAATVAAISYPAQAQVGFWSVQADKQQAVAYDGTSYSYLPDSAVATNGVITCPAGSTCSFMTAGQIAALSTPPSGAAGTPYVPSFTAKDPVTGASATAGPNGATFQNGTASTSVTAGGVSTNGTVSATTLATQDSHGAVYANVGDTLTQYGSQIGANTASIAHLQTLYSSQQGQINSLSGRMDKAYAGIAMATAFEAPQVDPGKRFGLSVNWADFAGVSGFSGVAKFRIDDHWSATGGVAGSQGGQFSGKVGIQTQW